MSETPPQLSLLQAQALEGVMYALSWHAVGVFTTSPASIGSGVVVSHQGRTFILSAKHVFRYKDATGAEQRHDPARVGFFFRPDQPGVTAPSYYLPVLNSFEHPSHDLIAVEL